MPQLFVNPFFAAWSKGSPRPSTKGPGTVAANGWVIKHNVVNTTGSASKLANGLRYVMQTPENIWDTFYLRQTVSGVEQYYGKSFRMHIDLFARINKDIWGGFYINLRWNNDQRQYIIKTNHTLLLPNKRTIYTCNFTMPNFSATNWSKTSSNGIEAAFIMDVHGKALVDIYNVRLFQLD